MSFQEDLKKLLNAHGFDKFSNTSDEVLSFFVIDCIKAYSSAIYNREKPVLTKEEIEAIEYFASFQWTMLKPYSTTLRSLLERLK